VGDELDLAAQVENLLFVIWVQDQRFDYWRKVLKETVKALEEIRDIMAEGDEQWIANL